MSAHSNNIYPLILSILTDDIGIAYYVNAIGDFLALEDFPSPSSFVRFSGELATCEMKILSDKLQTACISIYQE